MQKPQPARLLLPYLLGGTALFAAILGLFWLRLGRISGVAIGVAVGANAAVELFAVAQLLRRQRAARDANPRIALLRKARAGSGPRMEIQFCRKSLERLGPGTEPLLAGLRQRQHTTVVRECLNRCQDCQRGRLMASADGVPLDAEDGDKLLADLDELL
jgi:hypothetical protein